VGGVVVAECGVKILFIFGDEGLDRMPIISIMRE
jgi:hypothetical protein